MSAKIEHDWSSEKPTKRGVYRTRYKSVLTTARGWRYWDGKHWSNPFTKRVDCVVAAELGRLQRINCVTTSLEFSTK